MRTAANTWVSITGDLINANLLSIAFIPKESLSPATDDVLLVGGELGVFRAFTPTVGIYVKWTEFGTNLPNALVDQLRYVTIDLTKFENRRSISSDPLLLVGTQGRGSWTISNANVALAQKPVLTISGTDDPEAVVVSRNAANPEILEVRVNTKVVFTGSITSISKIVFTGAGGTDSLTVDSANGSISLSDGILFTGGDASDTLTLTGGNVDPSLTFPTTGASRTYSFTDTRGGGVESVTFTDFSTVAPVERSPTR